MPTGTGRLNRASGFLTQPFIEKLLQHEVARAQRYSDPLVLLRLGLHFKGKPDDNALRRARAMITHILNTSLRAVDIPGHFEDDYLIILPNTTETGGRVMAGRLAQALSALSVGDGGVLAPAFCMGYAAHPGGGDASVETLVAQTSTALAEARRRGANNIVNFAEIR